MHANRMQTPRSIEWAVWHGGCTVVCCRSKASEEGGEGGGGLRDGRERKCRAPTAGERQVTRRHPAEDSIKLTPRDQGPANSLTQQHLIRQCSVR